MKFFLTILFSLIFKIIFSQNISLAELFSLCNKPNWDLVNEYLTNKGWEYHHSQKGDDEHYSTITWTFNKSDYEDKAQGWFYLYTFESLPNKISMSFFNKQTYSNIKSSMAAAGMKLIKNEIGDNEIIAEYSNASFIVTLNTSKREEDEYSSSSMTAYSILVVKKSSVFDKDNGLKKVYDDDGILQSEFTLKNGLIHGIAKNYYKNGNLKSTINFIDDKKNGLFKEFNEDGNLARELTYANGLTSGKYCEYYYDDNNKLTIKVTGQYLNDLQEGLWKTILLDDKNQESVIGFNKYLGGKLNGLSKRISKDSIIFCSYLDDEIDGNYIVYRDYFTSLFGTYPSDTTGRSLVVSGVYKANKKNGYWKYRGMDNSVTLEGQYIEDSKEGEWKYYLGNYLDDKKEPLFFAHKLFLIETFVNDFLDGKTTRYAYLDQYYIPCPNSDNSSRDSCPIFNYIKVNEICYYKDGKLHGAFQQKDSIGIVRLNGNYINGKKDGPWLEGHTNESESAKGYIFRKGGYKAGKREGLWEEYTNENYVYSKFTYKNGKLHGKSADYFKNGATKREKYFEEGLFKQMSVYDSLGRKLISFEIVSDNKSDVVCTKTTYENSGKYTVTYTFKKTDSEPLNQRNFDFYFISAIPNGRVMRYDSQNKLLVDGALNKETKIGVWKIYYYDVNVYTESMYGSSNNVISETFFDLSTSAPFSGKFIQKKDGKMICEFKIENGFREGKSKYYDEQGKLIKSEKYKTGILLPD